MGRGDRGAGAGGGAPDPAGRPDPPGPSSSGAGELRRALASVRVVLVEPSHPGNVGAVARAMKSMGLARLCLVRPRAFPRAEATARAAGADDLLTAAALCEDLDEAVGDCAWVAATSARARHLPWPELDPADCARTALSHAPAEVALVFGRERSGLTNPELERCHAMVRIPTDPAFPSLNLGCAVQVLAYELRRGALAEAAGRKGARPPPARERDPPARAAELGRLYEHMERALVEVGYLDPEAPRLLMRRLRRLFNRAGMRRSELNILRGVLSAAQKSARAARR